MGSMDEVERFERERRDADRRYNEALTAVDRAFVAAAAQADVRRDDLERLSTALIVFLQQITAFVDTKASALSARTNERVASIEQALGHVAELRAQMSVVQRAVQSLTRVSNSPQSTVGSRPDSSPQSPVPSPQHAKYVAFEDQFRGTNAEIEER